MTQRLEPTEIKLLQKQKVLHVVFNNGEHFELPCEYLRIFSPSAEARDHSTQKPKLIVGKKDVNIVGIDPVGHYAVKLIFDDGHDTGIYSWETLYSLGKTYDANWQDYLKRLEAEGLHT